MKNCFLFSIVTLSLLVLMNSCDADIKTVSFNRVMEMFKDYTCSYPQPHVVHIGEPILSYSLPLKKLNIIKID